jgi:8-amino-3,8-dideoxy-alpha-D-manno-octulosonate transaminase
MFDRREFFVWGRGYRIDEIRAAILRVQLQKLPRVIDAMHASKYRLRRALQEFTQIKLRKIVDEFGDTGAFLITTFRTPEMAREITQALRAEGIVTHPQGVSNIVMTEWGLHLYYNIPSLVHKTGVDKGNSPWSLAENKDSRPEYRKGTCPQADRLFERSSILAVPSCLTNQDEEDIITAFDKVLSAVAA